MDLLFYLTLGLFILLYGTLDNNIDFDFFARLIVGKSFFQTGCLFNNDFYSYGTTHEFIDHEWGSSLIFYLLQNHLGDIGLFFAKSFFIFTTLFIITRIIKLEKSDIKFNFLFFFFIIQSISYNIFSTIRCQTFSFLFFVFYLYILKYAKKKNNYKILWTLPVLNILWANLHGGFAIGLILITLFAMGEFLNKEKSKPYFYALFACILTTLINPYGIKYIYFIFDALALNRIHITEWQSAFFSKVFYFTLLKFKFFFIGVLSIFVYSIAKNIKKLGLVEFYNKIDKAKYLIILFTLLISLKSLRFHVFFSYTILALCYVDFYNIFNKKLPKIIDKVKEIILFILILVSCVAHICEYKFLNITTPREFPVYCVEFIRKNNIKGNVFSNFHIGSYVAYKLYPNNHVFMDGRYEEVYDVELINKMGKFYLAKNNGFLKEFHHDILILDKVYPIANEMKKNKNYFSPWEDDNFVLYLSNKYKNNKFVLPEKDVNYYHKIKFITNIDWFN